MKTIARHAYRYLIAFLCFSVPALIHAAPESASQAIATAKNEDGGRAVAAELVAVVTAIDPETRELSLQGPNGETVTITVREDSIRLEDVNVGDRLRVTYLAALEGELRKPTADELAEPWLLLEETGASDDPRQPGVAGARMIRAVVTIEGMNRELGTATVKDSRGKLHTIGDIEPEKFDGITLGQTVVLFYTEALAITLQKVAAHGE
ncbi:MAG: hypothetical protein HRT77_03020 [Halioglobus sp.]|nr:hypothetical protein [Halioglobus sp.]